MPQRSALLIRTLAVLALLALLAASLACGGGEEEEGETPIASPAGDTPAAGPATAATAPKYGGTLRVVDTADPLYVDAHRSRDNRAAYYVSACTDRLILFGAEGELVPDLAESWEQPNAMTWVLHLRKGVKWQDIPPVNGREFTSADVKYNLERFTGNPLEFVFADMFAGVLKEEGGIETPDDYTVQLNLAAPNVYFLNYIAHPCLVMFAPEQVEAAPKKQLTDSAIGTGAFILTKYSRAVGAEGKKNPNYWKKDAQGNALPYLDGFNIAIMTDATARSVAFKTKQIDIYGVDATLLADLKRDAPDAVIQETRTGHNWYVRFVASRKPFDDLRMRQAVQYATNRQEYMDTLYDGHGTVLAGPVPALFGKWALPESEATVYDPDKAKALMAEAGYGGGVTVKCMTTASMYFSDAAVILNDQLGKVGIDVSLETISWGEWALRAYSGNGDHVIFPFTDQAYPSSDMYYRLRYTKGSARQASLGWSSQEAEDLMKQESQEPDEAKRVEMVHQIQRIIVAGAPEVYLLTVSTMYAWWPYVMNYDARFFEMNSFAASYQWEHVWLSK